MFETTYHHNASLGQNVNCSEEGNGYEFLHLRYTKLASLIETYTQNMLEEDVYEKGSFTGEQFSTSICLV